MRLLFDTNLAPKRTKTNRDWVKLCQNQNLHSPLQSNRRRRSLCGHRIDMHQSAKQTAGAAIREVQVHITTSSPRIGAACHRGRREGLWSLKAELPGQRRSRIEQGLDVASFRNLQARRCGPLASQVTKVGHRSGVWRDARTGPACFRSLAL